MGNDMGTRGTETGVAICESLGLDISEVHSLTFLSKAGCVDRLIVEIIPRRRSDSFIAVPLILKKYKLVPLTTEEELNA